MKGVRLVLNSKQLVNRDILEITFLSKYLLKSVSFRHKLLQKMEAFHTLVMYLHAATLALAYRNNPAG